MGEAFFRRFEKALPEARELALKLALNHSDKLNLKSDFAHVREFGRKSTASTAVLVLAEAPDSKLKCGVVCGRKFSLKAVERNRARRLLWESLRTMKPEISPCHMILIPRRRILECKMQDVRSQLRKLLTNAGMIIPAQGGANAS